MALLEMAQQGVQQTGATITLTPVMLTLIGMGGAFAAAYGVMKATIKQVTEELGRVRHDLRNLAQSQQTMMVETLERVTARRERVFNRLMDLFAANGGLGQ